MAQVDNIRELLESTATGQHLLLGEFVLPFAPGEDDPTGVTSNITDGRAQLWIDDDGALWLSIYSNTTGTWTTVGAQVEEVTEAQESTTDIKDVLVNAGLLEDGGITPLDLDGGDITVAAANISGVVTHTGTTFGAFSHLPGPQFTVAGNRTTEIGAVMGLLLAGLAAQGWLVDSTTA